MPSAPRDPPGVRPGEGLDGGPGGQRKPHGSGFLQRHTCSFKNAPFLLGTGRHVARRGEWGTGCLGGSSIPEAGAAALPGRWVLLGVAPWDRGLRKIQSMPCWRCREVGLCLPC